MRNPRTEFRRGLKYPDLFSSIVAFAGGFRRPEDIGSGGPSYVEMFNGDPEVFRAQHAWTLARTNAAKIRGLVATSMFVGNQDPGLENNRYMHAVLNELKIPHDYRESDGIAPISNCLPIKCRMETLHSRRGPSSFPQFDRNKAFVDTGHSGPPTGRPLAWLLQWILKNSSGVNPAPRVRARKDETGGPYDEL